MYSTDSFDYRQHSLDIVNFCIFEVTQGYSRLFKCILYYIILLLYYGIDLVCNFSRILVNKFSCVREKVLFNHNISSYRIYNLLPVDHVHIVIAIRVRSCSVLIDRAQFNRPSTNMYNSLVIIITPTFHYFIHVDYIIVCIVYLPSCLLHYCVGS